MKEILDMQCHSSHAIPRNYNLFTIRWHMTPHVMAEYTADVLAKTLHIGN